METIIDKLIGLAKQYEELGNELLFPNTHTYLPTGSPSDDIYVYFTNERESSVRLGTFTVDFYSKSLRMKTNATIESLEAEYKNGLKVLNNIKEEEKEYIKFKAGIDRAKQIERLRNELKTLENLQTL